MNLCTQYDSGAAVQIVAKGSLLPPALQGYACCGCVYCMIGRNSVRKIVPLFGSLITATKPPCHALLKRGLTTVRTCLKMYFEIELHAVVDLLKMTGDIMHVCIILV